jgi:cephalosporin-C deacetylase
MYVDLPEAELRNYRSEQGDPADFDDFWSSTLEETRAHPLRVEAELLDVGLTTVDVYDVTFSGYAGDRIKAWLRIPRGVPTPLPAMVHFAGYSGGRGHPLENLLWSSAGFAHLQVDTRGQGSGSSTGDTADNHGSGPQQSGFMTRGIDSKESYYYRRVFTDAVRAVEAARSLSMIDPGRVAALGASQGAGIALAVAGLVPDLAAAVAFVPFLCDFPRGTTITDLDPFKEIGRYLAIHRDKIDTVHETLSYFDGVNFAKRALAPAIFSTGLMDPVCPASTVFGAYNNYAGPKEMKIWPYNGHEGGGIADEARAIEHLRRTLGPGA